MPVEFSVAAYSFGHAIIRPTYKINDLVPEQPIFADNSSPGRFDAFHGFRPLPPSWTIDWQFFFETGDGSRLQMGRKIDAALAGPTFHLPGLDPAELARRNIVRGVRLGLRSGQRVSRAMGIEPLGDEEIADHRDLGRLRGERAALVLRPARGRRARGRAPGTGSRPHCCRSPARALEGRPPLLGKRRAELDADVK
jgi:hypothetical protein